MSGSAEGEGGSRVVKSASALMPSDVMEDSFDDDAEMSAVPRKRGETEMSVLKFKLQALGHKSQSTLSLQLRFTVHS